MPWQSPCLVARRRIPVRALSIRPLTLAVCKECGVGALRLLGVFRLFRWINRNRLVILTYHSVLPADRSIDAGEARNVVDEGMFAWQMRYLAKHYCCLRLEDAVALLRKGRSLPRHSVVVTFDDGFRNNVRYALPILRRHRVPATMFLTTGHIGRGVHLLWTERVGRLIRRAQLPQTVHISAGAEPLTLSFRTAAKRDEAARVVMKRLKSMPSLRRDAAIDELETQLARADREHDAADVDAERYTFMTWSEARELALGGMTIGSHTVEHPIMSSLDDDRSEFEVVASRQEIEEQLGVRCTLFSYPNGTADDFGDRDKANLQKAGYLAAVTQIAGVNDARADLFALRRVNIGRGHGRHLFAAQVSGFWPWLRSHAAARPALKTMPAVVLARVSPNGPREAA